MSIAPTNWAGNVVFAAADTRTAPFRQRAGFQYIAFCIHDQMHRYHWVTALVGIGPGEPAERAAGAGASGRGSSLGNDHHVSDHRVSEP